MAVAKTESEMHDVFGKTPTYFCTLANGTVATSDRVTDLLARGMPRKLSRRGLQSYLTYGAPASPLTLIDGIFRLPSGCTLKTVTNRVERTWMPNFVCSQADCQKVQTQVTEAVEAAVRRQMDENGNGFAAFLSGGIDSSAIVAVMRRLTNGEIRTYCVKHDDDSTEESLWAQKVADANGTKHTVLHLTDAMIRKDILNAISSYDQPTLDGVNFWFATKLVKEAGETAIMSGEGGDELFAGYDRFAKHVLAYRWARRMRTLGSGIWGEPVGRFIETLAPNEKWRKLGMLMRAKCDPYSIPRKVFSESQIARLLKPDLLVAFEDYQSAVTSTPAPAETDLINRISWFELQTVTTDLWLRDGYQTSAVHGLDVRTPLLDRELAELLFTVPGRMKCSEECLKPLLVRAAGAGLPHECVVRKKQGFSLPFDRYLTGELKEMVESFLYGGETLLFNPSALRRLGLAYRAGRVGWSRIWTLFVVENWCRINGVAI